MISKVKRVKGAKKEKSKEVEQFENAFLDKFQGLKQFKKTSETEN